jgi:hypothetical protein
MKTKIGAKYLIVTARCGEDVSIAVMPCGQPWQGGKKIGVLIENVEQGEEQGAGRIRSKNDFMRK